MNFVIIAAGGFAAYHQTFATEAEAVAAITASASRQSWTVYQLTRVREVKRELTTVTVP
jgi:hypothetical protein